MNQYFRLLFVSFIVFLLLGLNERRSEDFGSSHTDEVNLAFQAIHDGILPVASWTASEPILPALAGSGKLYLSIGKKLADCSNAPFVQTQSIVHTVAFMEHRTGIEWKTGYMLHLLSSIADPCLA